MGRVFAPRALPQEPVKSPRANRKANRFELGAGDAFGLAPAIEYSWSSRLGVLLGTRIIPAGHNTAATVTPAIAVDYVH